MSPLFDDPALYRSVLENLPIGIYVLDREQRVRFWNKGSEQITGYLAHEVTGQVCRESLPHCDPQGRVLAGDDCSISTTFREGRAMQKHVFTLHKQGHRLGVNIQTLPLVDGKGQTMGVAIAFEEGAAESIAQPAEVKCGCFDTLNGVSSQRLTRAVLTESLTELTSTHGSWGFLRVRVLGLKDIASRYGMDSTAAFLRTTAQTVRHSLRAEDFLGRWGNEEFLAMLQTSSPLKVSAMAEQISLQISQSEVAWWGDHFRVQALVDWTIASPGDTLESLFSRMKPAHTEQSAMASAAKSAASRG